MKRAMVAAFVLFCIGQAVHPAEIDNRATVDICVLPGGSIQVTWAAVAQVVGDDVESVQSLAITGELKSMSNLQQCSLLSGVTLDTCNKTFELPLGAVNFCGGQIGTSCGSYFRASSVSLSTPPKPSNGKQWSSCTFGDCGAERCPTSELIMLEKILGLPICF